jgi:hypothetical protein
MLPMRCTGSTMRVRLHVFLNRAPCPNVGFGFAQHDYFADF